MYFVCIYRVIFFFVVFVTKTEMDQNTEEPTKMDKIVDDVEKNVQRISKRLNELQNQYADPTERVSICIQR